MATEFHIQVQRVLERAAQLQTGGRTSFIHRTCKAQPELLREVTSLLPHYRNVEGFEPGRPLGRFGPLPGAATLIDEVASADELSNGPPLPATFRVEQFKLLDELGRGGMGIVYRAEHATLRHTFAIKTLRRELLTPNGRLRFAMEVELLRHLRRQGIAQLVFAGETKTAYGVQPYIVMEYIEGRPLTRFADEDELTLRPRLALFARVCEAVECAHHRGIIHGDLKPDNILVDGEGQPKILDFGIARFQDAVWSVVHDEKGRFIGTPAYASPEQFAGLMHRLTARSDVYSLGVIALEMLTGIRPDGPSHGLPARLPPLIQDNDRGHLHTDQEFRFYLTAILNKALSPSPAKRHPTAGKLAADVATLLERFTPVSRWKAMKTRLSHWLNPSAPRADDPLRRPLTAVLRTRATMNAECTEWNRPAGTA